MSMAIDWLNSNRLCTCQCDLASQWDVGRHRIDSPWNPDLRPILQRALLWKNSQIRVCLVDYGEAEASLYEAVRYGECCAILSLIRTHNNKIASHPGPKLPASSQQSSRDELHGPI